MPDTITPRIKPPNYTDREISERLEKAGELRKQREIENKKNKNILKKAIRTLKKNEQPQWIIDILKDKVNVML